VIKSAEEFVRLRNSEKQEEYSIAAEGEAPVSVWLDVIEKFPEMKVWVVHNRTIPLEVLELLASDQDRRVRSAVANKRKLSPKLFEILSQDIDEVVRQRIAFNKKTPLDVIEMLALDPIPLVSLVALRRLNRSE